jgi:hypothetical protein
MTEATSKLARELRRACGDFQPKKGICRMLKFKSLPFLAGAAAALLLSSGAHASLVLTGGTPAASFVDLGAQGFGNAPRLLTLQTHPFESGSVTPVNVTHDDAVPGSDKSSTPTLLATGWNSGANVGIGFNADQTGGASAGLTLDALVLTIFNGTTAIGSFSLNPAPVQFSASDLAMEQGNGSAIFNFGLTAAEQTAFNTIRAMAGSDGFFAGLSSSIGCDATNFTGCLHPADNGPDTFVAFSQAVIPAPSIGHGLPVLLAIGGLLLGARFLGRSKKHRGTAIPYAAA